MGVVTKGERINLRVAPQQKETITAAARMRGISATDFMVQSSLAAASEVLADQRIFHVPDYRWSEIEVLMIPPEQVQEGLIRLFAKPSVFTE